MHIGSTTQNDANGRAPESLASKAAACTSSSLDTSFHYEVPMRPGFGKQMLHAAHQHASQLQGRDAAQLGNRGQEIDIALWMLTCIAFLFLILRLYCKSYRHKDLWWDDWILILSWVRAAKYEAGVPGD